MKIKDIKKKIKKSFEVKLKHNLGYGVPKELKEKNGHMTAEVDKIDTQLNFEIGKEMLYLFDGFNSLPYDDFKVNDLPEAMKKPERDNLEKLAKNPEMHAAAVPASSKRH